MRFINAVPGLDTDINVIRSGDDEALVEGVNYGNEAGWNDEDPWTGALEVRLDGKETALAAYGTGTLRDWWTAEDKARFEAKGDALAAQYSAI